MKFLFTFTHFYFWQPIEPIAREFCKAGNKVKLLIDKTRNKGFANRFVIERENSPYEMGWMIGRRDVWQFFLPYVREHINYLAYLRKRQPTSSLLVKRWSGYLFLPIRLLIRLNPFKRWLTSDWIWMILHRLASVAPPSRPIIRSLEKYKPSIVIAASAVMPYSKELEYLKAAQSLGIPTIIIIPSWDNLTTKGTLQIIPDWLFVWNRGQVEEATKLHNIPEERIFCTGAPKFDPWFNLRPTIDRRGFCQDVGIDPRKPYLLYICSSGFIAGDETQFVDKLATSLYQHPGLQNLTLLVRPHPQNLNHWEQYQPKNSNTIIWQKDLFVMGTSNVRQDFYHSLYYSTGVVGINTSAFIETAIVDKPCIAIASDQYELTQMGIPHFKHLLDACFL